MGDVVFKKRARTGARDVRKREAQDEAPEDTRSAVVTKKTRAESSGAPVRVADRFGETTVNAVERANAGAENANENANDATRGAADWDVQEELARFRQEAPTNDDGRYRGLHAYAKFTETRDDGSSAKFKAKGPMRAPANVRTVTVVDYQPDICKDYKETGYCGFGDTCKFLHDRSDYLAGWQMDSAGEAADARAGTFGLDLEDDEEDIPFACLLCRQPFTDPVVTQWTLLLRPVRDAAVRQDAQVLCVWRQDQGPIQQRDQGARPHEPPQRAQGGAPRRAPPHARH